MSAAFLEVKDVRKFYGTTVALHGISFAVAAGEMFGLLGPNGAGKTTLLSILSCLLDASGGEVRIEGRAVAPSDREVRRLIGIVPQELAIYPELSARENLQFFGELYGLTGGKLNDRVQGVLEAIGLEDRADHRASTFSGGMKRRLNLGAALVHGPRLLLLDEPTTGVDPQSRNHIFEEVKRLNSLGLTVLYTSHYMEEVQTLCPRIGIMDQGRLVACDTLPNLLKLLTGVIRFGVSDLTAALRDRIKEFPGCTLSEYNGRLELRSRDLQASLVRLVAAMNETNVALTGLEIEEPNLEKVFLNLTGRALRD
jgi:ABC-2 type transport system ATP-binding protein